MPPLDVGIRENKDTPVPARIREQKPFSQTNLELEVRWLKDPLRLGDKTFKLLRKDQVEKALAIVRLVSNDIECTVSWNHLIDWHMSKGQVSEATKLYNEVCILVISSP